MPQYVIERDLPGAGQLTPDQLKAVSRTSGDVLDKLGPDIQWVHSYVTGDKICCIYQSTDEALIREHARQGGFPVTAIHEIKSVINPATAG
ncbi:DUF4242 domain-containing protein [Chitinophaga pollutisoli]|uniref:DUF4242 domain-containing protein n=1 Tax=Chitinophaga pollutisoli TaxID=3133966 RepID=A0ABZ2YPN0_9BACT